MKAIFLFAFFVMSEQENGKRGCIGRIKGQAIFISGNLAFFSCT
ncbi:hypothetical protein D068_cds08790 [Bacillus atrophaeus UCMB-5137]|nr:hypothetical protein D068_cds08790 [Bacillus atrophaeus UCMB-5137]